MSQTETKQEATDIPLMSRDEQLQLYRLKVERELQERIINWAQLRLAIVAGLVSVLISGGVFYNINTNITAAVKDVVLTETSRQIKAMEATRERAVSEMEQLNFQSKVIDRFVEDTRTELRRTRAEANEVAGQVKDTQPVVRDMIADMRRLKTDVEEEQRRAKDSSLSFSQYFQEQQFRIKSDMNEVRANIELLERGFSIIEELASAIRQKEPSSVLARQFAGFSNQWEEARTAYERRISDLRRRRAIKVIHYARSEASPERQRRTQQVVEVLQDAGFTVEEWQTPTGLSDFKAAEHVAGEFGIVDAKPLLGTAVVIHPTSAGHFTDIASILAKVGINVPAPQLQEIVPQKQDILSGGGSFKVESVVLLADLSK
jgi:hypothetical protein